VDIKFNEAPTLTASLRAAAAELELDHLWIVYPGAETYPIEKHTLDWECFLFDTAV